MPEKDKKRKRHSEGVERPKKRQSLDSSAPAGPKIKVTHIANNDIHGPVIASSPGITLLKSATFDTYHKKRSSSAAKSSSPNEILLHSSSHPRLDYTARENQDDANSAEGMLKHYIGVYDPQTHELQVVEARKVSIRGTLRAEEEAIRVEQSARQARQAPISLRQTLGLTFGTKKARKAISSIAENAISPSKSSANPTAAASAVINAISASASLAPSKADVQAASHAAQPRPTPNLDATTVKDVYTITEIVGESVLREVKVKPWVEAVEAGIPVSTSSRFVSRRIEDCVESDEIQKLKVLKYLLLLLRFYSALRPGRGKTGKKVPPREVLVEKLEVDSGLCDTIRRRFAEGAELTKWHVDKLRAHCCALSLIVDDFESDTHDLREDLGLTTKEISNYYSLIGAKVTPMTVAEQTREKIATRAEANLHAIARLSLPLQFPKERRMAAARRR